jgi:hypothetical protein
MAEEPDRRTVEQELRDLARTLDKHASGGVQLSEEVVTDLGKALDVIGDHLVNLHRRIEKLEESTPEWTTRGWDPPPGD